MDPYWKQKKIAFLTYPTAFQNIGGGEIVLLKLKEYLQKEGVPVDCFDPWSARVESYDILHVFGSVKDCLGMIRIANKRGVKVVTSPVLWTDRSHGLRYWIKAVCPAFPSERRDILKYSDLLIPNSQMELNLIRRLFAIDPGKMTVIYNGVDPVFAAADGRAFKEKYGAADFVLSVGRIEPRKNQLNLIRAIKPAGRRLVLIGDPVTGYEDYDAQCRKEGEGFVEFLPAVAHGDPILASAYAACRVLALQALFETPGLVALEAGLAGARVAATSGGSTREYFKEFVDYFDPTNPSEIRKAVTKAWDKPSDGRLKEHIAQNFTWDRIARRTADAYRSLL